jgi:hypothetical protein
MAHPEGNDNSSILKSMTGCRHDFEINAGYRYRGLRIKSTLAGLDSIDLNYITPDFPQLAGGSKFRGGVWAKDSVSKHKPLLCLDEPSNHPGFYRRRPWLESLHRA